VVETTPAPVGMAPAVPEPTVAAPDDDVPDLPAAPLSGFGLPGGPSKDLTPDTQAWVSRFISTEGASAPIKAAERVAPPPAFHEVTVADPHALPRIAVERRRAAVSPLPAGSSHPERRAVVNFPRAAPRRRSRGRWGRAIAGAAAAVATVCIGVVVVHRMQIVSEPPPGSQVTRIVATGAPAVPESARAAASPQPGRRTADPPSSRGRAAVSTRQAVTSTVTSPPRPDAAPLREPRASAPPEPSAPRLALEVAVFIFPDRAEAERQRLAAAGHRVRVVTGWEDGAPSYRVVVGSYSSRAAAERAADALLRSGLVQQARVVTPAGDQ
jgi:cell division protein FtsN